MTKYLVGEIDWQYNDEYYYRDGDGCIPEKIFSNKEEAEVFCFEQNLKFYKQLFSEPFYLMSFWSENWDPDDPKFLANFIKDLDSKAEFLTYYNDIYPESFQISKRRLGKVSKEDWKKVATALGSIKRYEVYEVKE